MTSEAPGLEWLTQK